MIGWFKSLSSSRRTMLLSIVGLLIVSLVRIFTESNDITSSGTMASALRVSTPLLLAGLACLWSERAGVVNIGIEGMMIVGSWLGGYGGWKWGAWAGIAMALIGGALVGLIHAVATVHFNVDHVVSGIAINILAAGSTEYLSIIFFKGQQGGGESQSPPGQGGYGSFDLPFLSGGRIGSWESPDVLGWIERQHNVPIVSDVAGLLRGATNGIYLPTLLALLIIPITMFMLWRTRFGLRLRASGESPQAGESLGVHINKIRYQALMVSGALASFGGAYLSCVSTEAYRQGQVAGQGFIGIATTIFGNWNPLGVLRGALLFGFPTALKYRDEGNVPALILVAAVSLALIAIYLVVRQRYVGATASLVLGGLAWWCYAAVDEIPQNWVVATPYIVTLIVLAGARQQLRPPAHAGMPYRPGESH